MLRVLRPDGRPEDADLLVARDTAAQSAQVSRVCDPPAYGVRQDTGLPPAGYEKAVSRQLQFINKPIIITFLAMESNFTMCLYNAWLPE